MNGTAEQRTQAALAISDLVDRTSPESLKPFVTQITGPLIRVVSERSVDVKCEYLLRIPKVVVIWLTFSYRRHFADAEQSPRENTCLPQTFLATVAANLRQVVGRSLERYAPYSSSEGLGHVDHIDGQSRPVDCRTR